MHAPPPDDDATAARTAEATIPRSRALPGPNPFREPPEPAPAPAAAALRSNGPRHAARPDSGWRRFVAFVSKPVFVFIAIGIIAAVPRFYHLSQPHDRVFDEVYYTKDGCLYAGFPYKQCDLTGPDEQSWVHPPLGKWMVAAGIRLFGNTQFGWRVSAAFIGTLTCVLIAMLAWLLWRSALWAFVAGLLAATESLLVVQSRTALLDIFEAFWIVAAFLFLALDKGWIERRTPVLVPAAMVEGGARSYRPAAWPGPDGRAAPSPWLAGPIPTTRFEPPREPEPAAHFTEFRTGLTTSGVQVVEHLTRSRQSAVPSPFWRPWRVAAGFAFGFAMAVKWSAVAALLGGVLLTFLWERTRRHRAGMRSRLSPHVAFEVRYGLRLAFELAGVVALAVGIPTKHVGVAAVGGALLVGSVIWEEMDVRWAGKRPPMWAAPVILAGIAASAFLLYRHLYLLALVPAAAAFVAWLVERVGHERSRIVGPFWSGAFQEGFPVIVCLFLLPVVVYLFTYSGTFVKAGYPPYRYRPGFGWSWMWQHPSRLADETYQMQKFHHDLLAQQYDSKTKKYTPAHPYQSRPWSWVFLGRPVAYYYHATHAGKPTERRLEVLGIGNPAIFWLQLIAIPWLAVMWRRRRDWRAGLILMAIVFQYGFWFLPDVSLQKVQFFFYATPIAPFFVLAATYVVRDLSSMRLQGSYSRPFLPVAVGFVIVAVALFAWFWPVLSSEPLTIAQWKARIWFSGWV